MSPFGYGWRMAAFAFVVLELIVVGVVIVGAVITQWEGLISLPVLLFAGVLWGCWLAAVVLPVSALVAVLIGTAAGIHHGIRRRRLVPG
jgi:hypothetical protein